MIVWGGCGFIRGLILRVFDLQSMNQSKEGAFVPLLALNRKRRGLYLQCLASICNIRPHRIWLARRGVFNTPACAKLSRCLHQDGNNQSSTRCLEGQLQKLQQECGSAEEDVRDCHHPISRDNHIQLPQGEIQ